MFIRSVTGKHLYHETFTIDGSGSWIMPNGSGISPLNCRSECRSLGQEKNWWRHLVNADKACCACI